MYIFIDESGSFSIPKDPKKPSVSCVGALLIPEDSYSHVSEEFLLMSNSWKKDGDEVKGKLLGEEEISEALRLFSDNNVRFDCVAFDAGLHTSDEVRDHLLQQVEFLGGGYEGISDASELEDLARWQKLMNSLSNQEYVQLCMTNRLVRSILEKQVSYYAMTDPKELARFIWKIDGKSTDNTHRMEIMWQAILIPYLEAVSLIDPISTVEGPEFDYASYNKFIKHDGDHNQNRSFLTILEEDRNFVDSKSEIGLQMVDVALSAARRMLMGNLQFLGWRNLPDIMTGPLRSEHVIHMIQLYPEERCWPKGNPYYPVQLYLRRHAFMLV